MTFLHLVYTISLAFLSTELVVHGRLRDIDPTECPEICECEPEDIGNDTYVSVNCSFRELTDVPSGVFKNTYDLRLNDNNITQLNNETFDGFPDVSELYLMRNKIEHIEIGTFNKLNLYILNLNDNKITTMNNLEIFVSTILNVDRNPIVVDVDTWDPAPIPSVALVSFQECGLSTISSGFFSKFPDVRYLKLAGNNIEHFSGAFINLSNLGSVDLSQNNIAEVNGADVLQGPIGLWSLDLSGNPLQSLDLDAVSVLEDRGELSISNTQFVCECQHWDIFLWATLHKVTLEDDCEGAAPCGFTISTTPTTTPTVTTTAVCGAGPACEEPEFCCDKGECSSDGKCAGAALAALPFAVLLLLVCTVRALTSQD